METTAAQGSVEYRQVVCGLPCDGLQVQRHTQGGGTGVLAA